MHLEVRGITRERMLEDDQLFLLTRVAYLCHKPAKYGDEVTLKTWEHSVKGANFFRCFALERDGERLCESISAWVLVDPTSRKILRPNEYKYEFLLTDEPITARICKNKITEQEFCAVHKVMFSETDGNGHLNNSNYGDLLLDHAPSAAAKMLDNGGILRSAEIGFLKEARFGEDISIHTGGDNGCVVMYGCFPDGKRCFEATAEVMV